MIESARTTNLTVAARAGTGLTANASSHTEAAAWTVLIADSGAAGQGVWVRVTDLHTAGADTNCLIDIAYGDITTGGNEVAVVTDRPVGYAPVLGVRATLGQFFLQYCTIPANKSISARIRATVSAETCNVTVMVIQSVQHLASFAAPFSIGVVTASSSGTQTPENTDDWGAWTEIGTTGADCNTVIPSYDGFGDITFGNASNSLVQLGYGANAPGSGGTAISAYWAWNYTTNEDICGPFPPTPVYADIASGTKLWARIAGPGTENRGITIQCAEGTAVSSTGGNANILGGSVVK